MKESYNILCSRMGVKPRILISEVLEILEDDLSKNKNIFYVVKAPTGYGKTSISLSLALFSMNDKSYFEKVIHVLPLRAIVEDTYRKGEKLLGIAGKQMMHVSMSPFLLYPITFVAIDTFLWDSLKLNTKKWARVIKGKEFGYDFFTHSSILVSLLVFDEVHMILDVKELKKVFLTVLDFFLKNSIPIIFLTATLSEKHLKYFQKIAFSNDYTFRVFPEEKLEDDFTRRETNKIFHIELIESKKLESLVDEDKRNLIIVNTVERAKNIYQDLKQRYDKILLIHGRYTLGDRERKAKMLEELAKKEDRYIIVSTQVIEAGVDISSDILITDIAPPISLIQRMGRNARYDEKEGFIYIVSDAPTQIYNKLEIKRTSDYLLKLNEKHFENFHPRLPWVYEEFINYVYRFFNVEKDKDLYPKIMNPSTRSVEILDIVINKLGRGIPFMRNFLIPVYVGDDILLLSPHILDKLISENKVEIKNERYKNMSAKDLAKRIVLNEDIKIVLGQEYYNSEIGLV